MRIGGMPLSYQYLPVKAPTVLVLENHQLRHFQKQKFSLNLSRSMNCTSVNLTIKTKSTFLFKFDTCWVSDYIDYFCCVSCFIRVHLCGACLGIILYRAHSKIELEFGAQWGKLVQLGTWNLKHSREPVPLSTNNREKFSHSSFRFARDFPCCTFPGWMSLQFRWWGNHTKKADFWNSWSYLVSIFYQRISIFCSPLRRLLKTVLTFVFSLVFTTETNFSLLRLMACIRIRLLSRFSIHIVQR